MKEDEEIYCCFVDHCSGVKVWKLENSELELVVKNFHKLKNDLFLFTAKNSKPTVLFHKPSLKAYYLEQQYEQFFSDLLNNIDPFNLFSWLGKNKHMLSKIWNELEYFLG
ncbi:hypothetical protein X928_09710 [Petrotoga miotherma DSM 10691]|uniref:Uncharacterized protein n=2 Tax=Petrotoga TaxID=28236 RepID=A0A2K1P3P2_9BACT|nr:hypothetical protein [Petrotoga halophila]PNR97419.1 hypothetical protein X928_09710 [Petrotoga miotherma DSM 10691]POZ92266.1 hypothetical protein AA81_08240 [Petrotoga halophila DSM 16923]